MTIKTERIDNFKKFGLGIFVHYGLYSALGRGEWAKFFEKIPDAEYEKLVQNFAPKKNWAEELAAAAADSGARYITLTARHHDGFSLYDTAGLSDFDAPHACGRDLAREFVEACRHHNIAPFFYHTMLDWRHPDYKADFSSYLRYLRASVEVLCKNYGEVGGFWFDGNWDKKGADWEEGALYGLIRKYLPGVIIINNSGLNALGQAGHGEVDCVTFERGRPDKAAGGLASEMCEVAASHWGYAAKDISFKSLRDILTSYMACRRYGANFLFNIGPTGDGSLTDMDKGYLGALGVWNRAYAEAVTGTKPAEIRADGNNFLLTDGKSAYYLFGEVGMGTGGENVTAFGEGAHEIGLSGLTAKVKRVYWLDNGEELAFGQNGNELKISRTGFPYGANLVWRVAKIEC